MKLDEYFKGTDLLENREKLLFDLINQLDNESFKVFSEVMDLHKDSFYKINYLINKCEKLQEVYNIVIDAFEYLNEIEMSGLNYAARRLQTKRLVIALMSVNAIMINIVLGIVTYIFLSKEANKQYADEIGNISLKLSKFDENRLTLIDRTLANSIRLLNSKLSKLKSLENSNIFDKVIASNNLIKYYINGNMNDDEVNILPDFYKKEMIEILQKDLNSDSDDICLLLSTCKNKFNNNFKLLKSKKNE